MLDLDYIFDADRRVAPAATSQCVVRDITVADLPSDWRIEFEERAAIREYDGGQSRERAEADALREIIARMQDAQEPKTGTR